MNATRSIHGVIGRISQSRSVFTSLPLNNGKKDFEIDKDFIADIEKKILEKRQILKRLSLSHFKARELSSSIANLRISMNSAQQKQKEALEPPVNAVTNVPSYVSIEILGNGTCHLRACVALRTPLKTYLFNCPEGTSRFLPQLRMKSVNVNDIFITRATWNKYCWNIIYHDVKRNPIVCQREYM
ncbi:hypothetical protein KIN20_032944, partial [Parelaphostrongylus tenuis]